MFSGQVSNIFSHLTTNGIKSRPVCGLLWSRTGRECLTDRNYDAEIVKTKNNKHEKKKSCKQLSEN